MRIRRALAVCGVSALTALPAQAEDLIVKCYFDWVCDPNRKCQDAGLDKRYRMDPEAETITPIGAQKSLTEMELVFGDRAITILEKPVSGGITATTFLMDSGDAVRSENEVGGRFLAPFQYLGSCSAT